MTTGNALGREKKNGYMKEDIAKSANWIYRGNAFQALEIAHNASGVTPFPGFSLQFVLNRLHCGLQHKQ